jgi:hypothetical protein
LRAVSPLLPSFRVVLSKEREKTCDLRLDAGF